MLFKKQKHIKKHLVTLNLLLYEDNEKYIIWVQLHKHSHYGKTVLVWLAVSQGVMRL